MKSKNTPFHLLLIALCFVCNTACSQSKSLKLVFIRHAEKEVNGDNLSCQGINRSMQLPAVLYKKFGKPSNVYVPAIGNGETTKHARMLETASPFVAKYNLSVNSAYDSDDIKKVGKALLAESGTVIIIWEHNSIEPIVKYLGAKKGQLNWGDSDYDSIWIVTFPNGSPVLTKDKEGLTPAAACNF